MPKLPNELLIPIVDYVYLSREQTPSSDILTLMMSSKQLFVLARPYLFRSLEHQHLADPALLQPLHQNGQYVREAKLCITWEASPNSLNALLACPSIEKLILSYELDAEDISEDEEEDARLTALSRQLYHTIPHQLSRAPCLSSLREVRIDFDGPLVPFYLTETHQIFNWLKGCTGLKSLKLWSSDLGGWRYEAMDDVEAEPTSSTIQEGTLLYFTQHLSKISGLCT